MIYLVDASVFIFRAYYSVPIEMTDRDGNPVNALHGFARFLGDLIERESPDYLAVAFDESLETSFRNEIYPAYKANRDPAPPDLKRQFTLCRKACRAMGIAEFASGRYEADDIIGTLVHKARSAGRPVTIVSRDKDLTQLLSGQDTYWDAVADIRYAHGDIEEKFGASPERMADLLALMGDASDNIPGVPGVGRKTAARLLKHFDHIDGVYANIENVSKLKFRGAASVAERLRQHRETALLSRRLTGIACDMPIDVEVEGLRRGSPDLEELERCYDEAGFGRMLRNQARRIAGAMVER